MRKILVSACLLGTNCKYDGGNNLKEELLGLNEFFDIVPFCPEEEGGLPTPRNPSEIKGDFVYSNKKADVTKHFLLGAKKALDLCKLLGIDIAILKEGSPSCGVHEIHNGRFDGKKIEGSGFTAKLLKENGIKIYNEVEAIDFLNECREDALRRKEKIINIRKSEEEKRLEEIKKKQEEEEKRKRKKAYFDKAGKPHFRGERNKPKSFKKKSYKK